MEGRGRVSQLERERVLHAADWRCELEGCSRDLADYLGEPGRVPQISHIVAAADLGPRADPAMPVPERNAAANLMALCDECARKIDSREGEAVFTVERLRAMKQQHEERVQAARREGGEWHGSLGSIMYLNVARLVVDAEAYGMNADGLRVGLTTPIDDLSIEDAGRLLVFADRVLPIFERNAVDLKSWSVLRRAGVGARFLFWRQVHARVFDRHGDPRPEQHNVEEGPHIYMTIRQKRILIPIRPQYVTSASARRWLSGSPSLIGLAQLRRVERDSAEMTPIALAVPNDEARVRFARLRTASVFATSCAMSPIT